MNRKQRRTEKKSSTSAAAPKRGHGESLDAEGMKAFQAGQPLLAAERLDQAVRAEPESPVIHMHLGLAQCALGRAREAEASFRQALAIQPDYFDASANLANLLWRQGRVDEAEASYATILTIRPRDVAVLNNFAAQRMARSDFVGAMDLVVRSLQASESPRGRKLFADLAQELQWTVDDVGTRAVMARAMIEPWTRPGELAPVVSQLVKLHPPASCGIARAAAALSAPLTAGELFGPEGAAALSRDELLLALLTTTENTDVALECFLTQARRLLLESADDAALEFSCALARQCFINEYVFAQTAAESEAAGAARARLEDLLASGALPSPSLVAAVASYFPLHALNGAERLSQKSRPQWVDALLAQQIAEPAEERRLRARIPRITPIAHATSQLVQRQYEENPYPRWVKSFPGDEPSNIFYDLSQYYPIPFVMPAGRLRGNPAGELLVAGCGTGRVATEWAQQYPGARILAVDLSLTSLAYAARKAHELSLFSIEFAQADILALGSMAHAFDVIECMGVLHHLADPFAGWQVLLSCLRPGGFMRLGFYSRLGRQAVFEARARIAALHFPATTEGIRAARQALMGRGGNVDIGSMAYEAILGNKDFYSTSGCRDFLFHVQEQLLSLPEIATFLKEQGLGFMGFHLPSHVARAYAHAFPDDPTATNLANWQAFEEANPALFSGMYQFWIQKPP